MDEIDRYEFLKTVVKKHLLRAQKEFNLSLEDALIKINSTDYSTPNSRQWYNRAYNEILNEQ